MFPDSDFPGLPLIFDVKGLKNRDFRLISQNTCLFPADMLVLTVLIRGRSYPKWGIPYLRFDLCECNSG